MQWAESWVWSWQIGAHGRQAWESLGSSERARVSKGDVSAASGRDGEVERQAENTPPAKEVTLPT